MAVSITAISITSATAPKTDERANRIVAPVRARHCAKQPTAARGTGGSGHQSLSTNTSLLARASRIR